MIELDHFMLNLILLDGLLFFFLSLFSLSPSLTLIHSSSSPPFPFNRFNSEVSTHLSKAQDDITPLRAQQILKAIPPDEVLFLLFPLTTLFLLTTSLLPLPSIIKIELLDMQGGACKPENLILTHHLVPPVCTRPVVNMDTSGVTNQDDITVNLRRIIGANSDMR